MREIKRILFFLFILMGFLAPTGVFAAGAKEEFSLGAIDYDVVNDQGTFDELVDGSQLEPGKIFQIDVHYSPGDVGNLGFNYTINYDNTIFEPIHNEDDGEISFDDYTDSSVLADSPWPTVTVNRKKQTKWVTVCNDTGDQLICNVSDSTQNENNPFVKEGIVTSFWIKVKDDAPSGSTTKFEFENTPAGIAVDRIDKVMETISVTNLSFKVNGSMSSDVTLKSLTLTGNNALNYVTTPLFQAGTSDRTFSIIVPYAVNSINIVAEATDSAATILAGGLGNKSLSVGDNSFNLVVQSENLSQEIYVIKVYRLSNDASLKTLSLSGVSLDTSLTTGVYTYTATVPYSINSTTVSATANHTHASVKSGTGSWDFSNTGSDINTKTVTVEAEDCDSKYTSVAGNSCTSQNYTLNVTRTAASTDNHLTDIKVDGVSISGFNSSKYEYTLPNVANNKSSVSVTATLSDSKASLTGDGNKNLIVGDNKITLTVTSESGAKQEYVINMKRLSNNANLATLNVTSTPQGVLSPNFTPTFANYYTYTYDSTVTSIDVSGTVEHAGAVITSGAKTYSSGDTEANVLVTAEDGTTQTYVIKFSRNKSSDNTLKSLSIDGVSFNETFSPTTTLYTATVPGTIDSINVNAVVNDSHAKIVSGTGSHALNYGPNTIQVRVEAENKTTKDYTITINRNKKDISTLSDLTVDGVTVAGFSENVQTYNYGTVTYDKTSVEIGYTKKDSDSTVTGDGTVNLKTGNNIIKVVVTAQDGVTKTSYEIQIYRTPSNNAYLSVLSVDGYPFNYVKTTNDYSIEVPYEVTSVNITATTEDTEAVVVKGGPSTLSVGDNLYTFAVTAEDGSTTNVYNLKVTRKKSTNVKLANLTVTNNGTNYLDSFSPNTETYNINVDYDVSEVDIIATLDDSINQTVSGAGHKSLTTGPNRFEVIVTAASLDTKKYIININRALSSNNNLSSLEILGHSISPNFSPEKTNYTAQVDSSVSQIVIQATAEDGATVTGTGTKTLVTGENTFRIDVESEDHQVKTYVIVVTREASDDSSLKSLSLKETLLNEPFVKTDLNYTASVANSVDKVTVLAQANDPRAKSVTGTGEVSLSTGDNTIHVVVTAEDNSTTTYTIVVNRAKSANANLSDITLTGGYTLNKTFDPNDLSYRVEVPNNVSKITVSTTKQDPNATVTGDGEISLSTGDNTVTLTVLAEDKVTKKVYTVVINREKSNNNLLSSLTSSDGLITPTFDPGVKQYSLTVPYEVLNANLVAVAQDTTNATISVNGNTNLAVGKTTASIIVTAENGDVNTYYVDITRQPSSNNYLSDLQVTDSDNHNYITSFNKTTMTYNIDVDNDITSLKITATAEDSTTQVSGTGTKSINVGSNQFTVKSLSADGTPRNYVININRAKNSNADLTSLAVDGYTLVPDFSKGVYDYSLTVDETVDSINITASAEVDTTQVKGTGNKQLHTGLNTFNIETESEDGTKLTYVITVNKAASSNNYLASLLMSEAFTPSFDREELNYQAVVSNTVTSVNVQAVAEDANATVSGNGDHSLNVGNNSILITVTAENNTFRAYTINVYREPSSNKRLSDLKVDNQTISGFDPDKLTYTLTVGNEVTELEILGVAEDSEATVTGNKTWYLNTGVNTTDIVVTAGDGTSQVYTLEVTRQKSSNNNLAILNTLEGTLNPTFDRDTTDYTMDVPYDITNLTLTTVAEDANATVTIDGNANFQVGDSNMIYITVKAEDESIKKYQIQVNRLPQANNFLSSLNIETVGGRIYPLSPAFEKNTLNYTVDIDATDSDLILSGVVEDSSATVAGLEHIQLSSFPYVHKVVVTAANGVIRTYSITFNKIKSSNANLKDLSISTGTLVPQFNENETTYQVKVPASVDSIDITALGYEGSSIVGDGVHQLSVGNNTIQISVTAEDGSTKNYTINVEREQEVLITLDDIQVTGGILSPSFKSEVNKYIAFIGDGSTEVVITPIVSDPLSTYSISLDDGGYQSINSITVDDLTKESKVDIKVENGSSSNIYTVYVLNQSSEKITSLNYGHVIEDGMIKTVKVDTTVDELKDQLDNDNEKLKIYQSDGVTEYNGNLVGTGMIVKLIIHDQVVDQKTIVVVGDTDGNGIINALDALKVVNHIIETEKLFDCYLVAAETTNDTVINALDALRIVNHIVGNERLS